MINMDKLAILEKAGLCNDKDLERSKKLNVEITRKPDDIMEAYVGEVKIPSEEGNRENHPKISGLGKTDCDCDDFICNDKVLCSDLLALLREIDENKRIEVIKNIRRFSKTQK